ncbi:histidine kinase [bacterium SCSIO 12741]|nr:histidine kinase [bacterium SCSIO 12741]
MNKTVVILLHAGYWFCYLLLLAILFAAANAIPNAPDPIYQMKLVGVSILMPSLISFYIFYFVLFNRFLQPRKWGLFILSAGVVSAVAGLLAAGLAEVIVAAQFSVPPRKITAWDIFGFLAFVALVNGILALVLKGFVTWFKEIRVKDELKQKNLQVEMNLVKSQLQPHFLFNTINNIDVLINRNPEKASNYLQKLSELMRFMLYETKADKIPLSQEIQYIERYLDLQRIRSANADFIKYEIEGSSEGLQIAPMIFIPIIENAFKHSGNKKETDAISIAFRITNQQITLNCKNLIQEKEVSMEEQEGLGKQLIEKRLNLLYPNKHLIQQGKNERCYHVTLTLDLNEN